MFIWEAEHLQKKQEEEEEEEVERVKLKKKGGKGGGEKHKAEGEGVSGGEASYTVHPKGFLPGIGPGGEP